MRAALEVILALSCQLLDLLAERVIAQNKARAAGKRFANLEHVFCTDV